MSIPLDDDWNDIKPKQHPREVKGGTFAPADMDLIKRALYVYKIDCVRSNNEEDLTKIANLLHRIGRIS